MLKIRGQRLYLKSGFRYETVLEQAEKDGNQKGEKGWGGEIINFVQTLFSCNSSLVLIHSPDESIREKTRDF